MEVEQPGDSAHAFGRLESCEYPRDYPDQDGGRGAAKLRPRQERGGDARFRAAGDYVALGGVVIPRIGMEVVVDFIDGSPDKPIVTGCVINGKNGNIYGLPARKTNSGFKTKAHEGSGFNDLSFEDPNGSEKIFMHAQKDVECAIRDDGSALVETGDGMKAVASGNLTEAAALTRASQANVIIESTLAGKAGPRGDRLRDFTGGHAMEAMGFQRISGDGEMPATIGHPIAHTSGWSLGAMVLGAIAAVAVGGSGSGSHRRRGSTEPTKARSGPDRRTCFFAAKPSPA